IGGAGFFWVFPLLFLWVPGAGMFPLLLFVGLGIISQSFRATPERPFSALALAVFAALGQVGLIVVGKMLGGRRTPLTATGVEWLQTLTCLANGFIISSLLWAAALAALLDGRLRLAAAYLFLAGVAALFGVIHSPLAAEEIAWPWKVMNELPAA